MRVGDLVWIGEPGDLLFKATWEIVGLYEDEDDGAYAVLRSGRTGRRKTIETHKLTPFRGKEKA